MDGAVIAAIITGSCGAVVALIQLFKPKPQDRVISKASDISDSMVAVGTNINQSYSPTVHNYNAPAQDGDPFSSKVESTPTIANLINDLEHERRPYEASQAHKAYVGLQVCWPVTFYGLWEDTSPGGSYTVRLASLDDIRNAVIVYIDIDDYPKLRVAERGHPAWVEGEIRDIDFGNIFLKNGARITLK